MKKNLALPILNSLTLAVGLTFSVSPALADDDSSSDAAPGFEQVKISKGVMIKAPRDAQGRDNTDAAEIRIYSGDQVIDAATNLTTVWEQGEDASSVPVVTDESIGSDSSTSCGWYGGYGGYGGYGYGGYGYGYGYGGYGYSSNYYSSYYRPSYYGYGNYYNYGSPYSYGYGNSSYYYYPSTWY